MGVTSFQQSLYEFFDSGLLFRMRILQFIVPEAVSTLWVPA